MTRRTVALVVMGAWLGTGGIAAPATGEAHAVTADHDGAPAAVEGGGVTAVALPIPTALAPAAANQCPSQLSCGYQCVAELTVSLCLQLIDWTGGIKLGGVQLGPSVHVQCHVCDCWYIQPGPNGRLFKRTVDFGCGGSIEGLTLQ